MSDLSQLKDMKTLRRLVLNDAPVTDLSPLATLSLQALDIYRTRVTDLSPLKGMPLKKICLDPRAVGDGTVLRSLGDLESINRIPAAVFWKGQGH